MDMVTFNRESKNMMKVDKADDALGELAKLFSCSDIHVIILLYSLIHELYLICNRWWGPFLIFQDEIAWNKTVQDGIRQFFEMEENKDKLSVLSVVGLNGALALFTEGGHTDAFENLVEYVQVFLYFLFSSSLLHFLLLFLYSCIFEGK